MDADVAPYAAEFDRSEQVPGWLLGRLAELGYWGAVLAPDVSPTGMDMVTFGALHEEVGRGCSSVRSLLTVHSMVTHAIAKWGTAEQKDRWLPRLGSGEVIAGFCLTEPDAGSDAANITTTATRRGDGHVLDGHKKWITGGQLAGLFLIFARTERGISSFLVERDSPGLQASAIRNLLGTRASMLAEIILEDCTVERAALLGPDGFALATVLTGALDIGRYSVACGCVGIIQACLEACASYTAHRVHRSGPLKDQQLIRRMMTDMVTNAEAARLLCLRAGRLKDSADPATVMATWIAKYFASTSATAAASDAVQIHGANGCGDEYPVNRHYRDAKIMEIIEGSTQIQQIVIAEEAYRAGAHR